MRIDPAQVEDVARELYIRALKILPPDVKEGFARLAAAETDATARKVLGTMITNIRVAEDTENLLCQDTGIPIYNVTIGRGVELAGTEVEWAIPAEGVGAIKTFVIDCVLEAGGKTCPPTIVGVGIGGTSDLCVALAKQAATRALGTTSSDAEGAALEKSLTEAVNSLGVGPQGLGGESTAFAGHGEIAATHITMNPVAVNMQCHSARRASASFTPAGVEYGC